MTVTSAYSLTSRMAVVNSRNVRRRRAVSEPVRSSGTIHLRPRARSSGWDGDAGAHACGAALRHGVRTSGSSTEGLCAPCAGCACRRTAGMPDVDRNRKSRNLRQPTSSMLSWQRRHSTGRPVISFKSRAGTASRRSAARSVVSGPDCDTDRRCVRRSGLGGRGEEVDVVVAAVAGSHHWPRRRRRIIIGPIGLTIWGCAGRQRDRRLDLASDSVRWRHDDVLRPRRVITGGRRTIGPLASFPHTLDRHYDTEPPDRRHRSTKAKCW